MKLLSYLILPLGYLAIGGTVTYMLLRRLVDYAATTWPLLLVPMIMLTTMLTVIGLCNVWVHYRTWNDEGLLRVYTTRRLLWLYLRCWLAVMAGLTIGVIFYWMQDLLVDAVQRLTANLEMLFYAMLAFLTGAALLSIIRGEDLSEIRLQNTQNENQLLKAQLNPHFLYNTLNNIDALIWLDQERASGAVTNLSSLMRYLTYSGRQERVPLKEEIAHIRQFVDLQRMRIAEGNSEEIIVTYFPDIPESIMVPPLLLIPLVENAFKHCGRLNDLHSVVFSLSIKGREFIFTTDNTLPETDTPRHKDLPHGVGLSVLRRRLKLLLPGRFRLEHHQQDQRYIATLAINY